MIIFRQKQYDSPLQMDGYKSTIINTGGVKGEAAKVSSAGQRQVAESQKMAAQISNQQEIMRQRSLQAMNTNQIRNSRNEGLKDRGEAKRGMQVAAIERAKKQASVSGIQNAKELEKRKNASYVTPYKSPTKAVTPISSKK